MQLSFENSTAELVIIMSGKICVMGINGKTRMHLDVYKLRVIKIIQTFC